jgi:hypothetical protein
MNKPDWDGDCDESANNIRVCMSLRNRLKSGSVGPEENFDLRQKFRPSPRRERVAEGGKHDEHMLWYAMFVGLLK